MLACVHEPPETILGMGRNSKHKMLWEDDATGFTCADNMLTYGSMIILACRGPAQGLALFGGVWSQVVSLQQLCQAATMLRLVLTVKHVVPKLNQTISHLHNLCTLSGMIKPAAASRQGLGVRALATGHSSSNKPVPPSHSRMHQKVTDRIAYVARCSMQTRVSTCVSSTFCSLMLNW